MAELTVGEDTVKEVRSGSGNLKASKDKKGKKRKLDQNLEEKEMDEISEPKAKRQKLSVSTNKDEHSKKEMPSNIKKMIENSDLWETSDKITDIRYLENERITIYKTKHELFKTAPHILSIEYQENDELFETIIIINQENNVVNIELEDKIMMDTLPISECIEYRFSENGEWFIGEIASESLKYYRKSKFESWKKSIMNPDCAAAFKRLLRIGLIDTMFDRFVFPSPEHERDDYIVKDDNGKNVDIPRAVQKLRKWSVKTRSYEEVQCRLDGAPDPKDVDKYWEDMIDGFKTKFGTQYIDDLLASFKN